LESAVHRRQKDQNKDGEPRRRRQEGKAGSWEVKKTCWFKKNHKKATTKNKGKGKKKTKPVKERKFGDMGASSWGDRPSLSDTGADDPL